MDAQSAWEDRDEAEQERAAKFTGRPSLTVITSTVKLIIAERDIRSEVKGEG
jgi:hypothetical protein